MVMAPYAPSRSTRDDRTRGVAWASLGRTSGKRTAAVRVLGTLRPAGSPMLRR